MHDALPLAEIVHAIPGRVRLRIATRRGDAAFFASIATGLSTISGISRVEVRPLTASVLLQHALPLPRIGQAARQARLFVVTGAPAAASPPLRIEPKLVAAAGLGIFALWQLGQGRVLPPAITLGWYAAHLAGLVPKGDLEDGE